MPGANEIKAGGAYVEIGGSTKALRAALRAASGMVKTFSSTVKRIAIGVASATRAMAASFAAVGRAITNVVRRMKDFAGRQFKRAAIAIVGALSAAAFEASKFETAMREVHTITNLTTGQLGGVAQALLKLAKTYGGAPTTMARAFYQTISAGVTNANEALQLMDVAAKAAVAGITDTFTAVDVLTTVINSYGMSVDDAAKISDQLFTAVREGKTTFAELGRSVGTVTAIASQAGVSFDELMAATATLTKGGVNINRAMTALRQTIVTILNPSEEAAALAKKLGIQFSEWGLKTFGLGAILRSVQHATKGNIKMMSKLFPNIRALTGVLSLAGSQSKEFAKQLLIMRNTTGATESAFAKMATTARFKLGQAMATIRGTLIEFGMVILPFVARAAKGISSVFEQAGQWARRNRAVIREAVSEVYNWIARKGRALQAAMKEILSGLKRDHGSAWNGIKAIAKKVWDWFGNVWSKFKEVVLDPVAEAVKAMAEGDWKKAWGLIVGVVDKVMVEVLLGIIKFFPLFVQMGVDLMLGFFDAMLTADEKTGVKPIDAIADVLREIIKIARKSVPEFMDLGFDLIFALIGGLMKVGPGGTSLLEDVGDLLSEGIIGSFVKNLKKRKEEITGAIQWIAETLVEAVKTNASKLAEIGIAIGRAIGGAILPAIKEYILDAIDWLVGKIPGLETLKKQFMEWQPAHLSPGEIGYQPEYAELGQPIGAQQQQAAQPAPGGGGGTTVNQYFNYRLDRNEVEKLRAETLRSQKRGRIP